MKQAHQRAAISLAASLLLLAAANPALAQSAAPATLRGLILLGDTSSAAGVAPRTICKTPPAGQAQTFAPSSSTPAAMRQTLSQLPASASAKDHIASSVAPQLLAADAAKDRLAAFIGQPINDKLTQSVVAEIVALLNQDSRYLADVYFPEQTAADGILSLAVRPALLGTVTATGQKHHEADDITCRISLQAGQPVDLKVLSEDIAQLNASSSWRSTAAPQFKPGAAPGTTDLVLTTTDEKPLRFFVGGDNTGTRTTGEGRYRGGVNIGNFLGKFDHQFDYTLTSASDYSRYHNHSFGYQMPLEGRQRLLARLDLSETDVLLEQGLFRSKGDNQIASLEWTRPQELPAAMLWGKPGSMASETSYGLEYERIGNSLAFNQIPLSDVAPEVFQAYAAWRAAWQGEASASQLYTRLTLSPGGINSHNNNDTFGQARLDAKAAYWRINAAYNHQMALPSQWALALSVNGQLANKPLISSERMTLSGWGGVRGYYQDTLTADAGVTASLELQTPRQNFKLGQQNANWYALAFVDAGRSWNASKEFNADLNKTGTGFSLASVGVGIRIDSAKQSSFRLDLARRNSGLDNDRAWLWHGSWQAAF